MFSFGLAKKSREYLKQFIPTMKLNEKSLELYATSPLGVDKKGYLSKKGEVNTEYQKRWFVLKGNLLYYFDKETDRKPNGVIIMDSCSIELADTGEPFAFQIVFSGERSRNYILAASSDEEMLAWMRALTHASFSYTKLLVDSFQARLEALRNRDRSLTESGNKRISKLRPFSLLQTASTKDTRSFTQTFTQSVHQPTKPPRKAKDKRKLTDEESVQVKTKEAEEVNNSETVIDEPCCSGVSLPVISLIPDQLENHNSEFKTSSTVAVENLIPVDVNAINKSRSDTSESESDSRFYTLIPSAFSLHYFTPPDVGEYMDKNDPLSDDEIFTLPLNNISNTSEDKETSTSVTMPRNGKIRSRIHHFSKSERRPTTRQTRFHTEIDLWTASDDFNLERSRSPFRSIHDSFGASIWVKVQNFEAVIENLMKKSPCKD